MSVCFSVLDGLIKYVKEKPNVISTLVHSFMCIEYKFSLNIPL